MQPAASRQQPNPNFKATGNSRSTLIAILALFLMTGFATGTFTRPKPTPQQSKKDTKGPAPTTVVPKQTPVVTITSTVQVTKLGWPAIQDFAAIENADGTTSYTFSAYPVDQSIDSGHGQQVHAPGITCKLWITKDEHATATLKKSWNKLQSIDSVRGVLPTEKENAFTFSATPQTQTCSVQGLTTWTYTISPNVEPGKYYLVVLADWKGIVFNWNTRQITIMKAD